MTKEFEDFYAKSIKDNDPDIMAGGQPSMSLAALKFYMPERKAAFSETELRGVFVQTGIYLKVYEKIKEDPDMIDRIQNAIEGVLIEFL